MHEYVYECREEYSTVNKIAHTPHKLQIMRLRFVLIKETQGDAFNRHIHMCT